MEKEGEAFHLFPEEVWELILGKLESSIDILNAYKAYPELEKEGVLKSQIAIWCFEQIIPHLLPWLNKREALFCRQVCWKWSLAIDTFLENHTRIHSPDVPSNLLNASPFTNFNNLFRLPSFFDNYNRPSIKFLPKMGAHPPDRNPFIGRSVAVIFFRDRGAEDDLEFWTGVLEMFRLFGKHIWFLTLHYFHATHVRFSEIILNCLALVPNLRELSIKTGIGGGGGGVTQAEAVVLLESRRDSFPLLSHLEAMGMECGPRPLLNFLVSRHSPQISKLFVLHPLWEVEYFQMFPKLRDLCLRSVASKEELTDFLLSLQAPELRTLDLGGVNLKMNVVGDILPFLNRFPLLNSLTVGLNSFNMSEAGRRHCFPPFDNPILSIKSLAIWMRGEEPDAQLFGQLPSLEYLRIQYDNVQEEDPFWFDGGKLYGSGIWERMSKLREIIATSASGNSRKVHYSRARYELWKMEQMVLLYNWCGLF